MAIGDHDPRIAADVAERLVMRAGNDVTAIATHQSQLSASSRGGVRRRLVPGLRVA